MFSKTSSHVLITSKDRNAPPGVGRPLTRSVSKTKTEKGYHMNDLKNQAEETYDERLTREKKERREFNILMVAKFEKVANILGLSMSTKDGDNGIIEERVNAKATLQGEGVSFRMVTSHNYSGWAKSGMIAISSQFPRGKTEGGHTRPFGYEYQLISINVSNTKTPEQIASAIGARFMPTHLKEFADVVAKNAETDGYHTGRADLMETIGKETGLKVQFSRDRLNSVIELGGYMNTVKSSGRKDVEISLCVNEWQAIQIIKCALREGVGKDA